MSYVLRMIYISLLVFNLTGCGGGGDSSSNNESSTDTSTDQSGGSIQSRALSPTIVSIDSTKMDEITIFWLAIDESSVKYEVHLSIQEGFTPDSSTLKKSLTDINEADITGLSSNTTYYAKIVSINSKGEKQISDEMSLTTAISNPKLAVDKSKIKTQTDLNVSNADIKDDSITFDRTVDLKADDIIIGTQENPYLRRVTSATTSNGKTEVQTENIPISDVISDVKLSSKTVLFKKTDVDAKNISRSVTYKTNKTKETTSTWKSGRFSVTTTEDIPSANIKKRGTEYSNEDFKMTIATDSVETYANKTIKINLEAIMKQHGIDDDVKFTMIKLKSFTNPDNKDSSGNNFGAYFTATKFKKHSAAGYFKWTPRNKHARPEPYVATFEVSVEDEQCGLLDGDICENYSKTIEAEITVLSDGEIDTSGEVNTKLETSKEFTNDLTFDFTPILTLDHTLKGSGLEYAKVELGGKLDLNVLSKFKFNAKATKEYKPQLIKPITYKSVYYVGAAVIYQTITFTLDAELTAVAEGSIEATSNFTSDYTLTAGVEYDGNNWKEIPKNKLNKDYTATVEAAGGVMLNVRFIPNVEVKFYEVASAGLSIEPWAEGELRASATAKYNTDFTQQDVLGLYKLDKLDFIVGVEGKIYADLTVWGWNLAHYPSGGGKKTIFNPRWTIFSLPTISLENPDNVCQPFDLTAKIEDGAYNPFDYDNTSWVVFPETGSTVTENNSSSANITFDKQDKYEIYFVGNSEKLGAVLGKQYEYITIDTTSCEFTTQCQDTEVLKYNSDGSGYCEVKTGTNTQPVANAQSVELFKNTAKPITLSGTDADGNPLTYTITSQPSHGTLNPPHGTTQNVTYTPNADYEGGDSFTFKVNDGTEDSAEATVSITVNETSIVNTKPVANAQSVNVTKNTAKPITLSGTDADGNSLTYTITSQPSNGTLSGTAPNVTYTPNADYSGSDSFAFTVNDGTEDSAEATVSITVQDDTTSEPLTNIPVLKTGQTTSYTNYDDGYYQKGLDRSYSRSGNIATDNVTGLQWQDDEAAKTTQKDWEGAKTYCSSLTLDGYGDWRLPNIQELLSITDLGKYNPAIDSTFQNTSSGIYRSITSGTSDSDYAWGVNFDDGNDNLYGKLGSVYVRCVRAGQ